MSPTALPLMAAVKMEDVVAENTSGGGPELRSATRNAYEKRQISMKALCVVYDFLFQMLLEVLEQSGENVSEVLHAVVCDPYNTDPIPVL